MDRRMKYTLLFIIGGVLYALTELLWRGYTHITMIFAGAIAFVCLYLIRSVLLYRPLVIRMLAGACAITAIELAFGVVFNIILGMNVWDYSDRPFSLYGQICLDYFILWFLISIPAFYICGLLDKYLLGEKGTNAKTR